MSGKSDVIADGPKDKKQSKNCFYVKNGGVMCTFDMSVTK